MSEISDQAIRDRLAATWESHMHDGNGAIVTAVFLNVLREMAAEGEPRPFDLQNRVIETAFEAFENEADGGLVWAVASNAVSGMAREFASWLRERKAGVQR